MPYLFKLQMRNMPQIFSIYFINVCVHTYILHLCKVKTRQNKTNKEKNQLTHSDNIQDSCKLVTSGIVKEQVRNGFFLI